VKNIPQPVNGIDGRDAPTLEEIIEAVRPLLPEAKVERVQTTVREDFSYEQFEEFLNKKLPEMEEQFRPKTELIREELDESRLEDFVSKKDLDDALRRVQRAIEYSSGGGGGGIKELVNVIQVEETSTVTSTQINPNRINVVLVNQPNITVTLPTPSAEVFIIVQQGYNGDETFQVCYE
jgi:hypothetical protein